MNSLGLLDSVCQQILSLCICDDELEMLGLVEGDAIETTCNLCRGLWKTIYILINLDRSQYEVFFEDNGTIALLHSCIVSWVMMRVKSVTSIEQHSVNLLLPLFFVECGLIVLLYNIFFFKEDDPVWEEILKSIPEYNFFADISTVKDVSTCGIQQIVSVSKNKMVLDHRKDWKSLYFDIVFNVVIDYKDDIKSVNLLHMNELGRTSYNIIFSGMLGGFVEKHRVTPPDDWKFPFESLESWLSSVSKRGQTDTYERFCRGLICTLYLNCCDHDRVNVIDAMDGLSRQDPDKVSEIEAILSNNSQNYQEKDSYDSSVKDMCSIALFDYYMRQVCDVEFVGKYFMSGYSYKRLFLFIDKYRTERMKNPPPLIFNMNGCVYLLWKDDSNQICSSTFDCCIRAICCWIGYVMFVRKGKLNISMSIDNLVKTISSANSSGTSGFFDNPFRDIRSTTFS